MYRGELLTNLSKGSNENEGVIAEKRRQGIEIVAFPGHSGKATVLNQCDAAMSSPAAPLNTTLPFDSRLARKSDLADSHGVPVASPLSNTTIQRREFFEELFSTKILQGEQ